MIMEDIYYKKDVSTTYDNLCYTYSMDFISEVIP